MKKAVIITGSPSLSSRLTGVLEHLAKQLSQHPMEMKWIHAAELPAEDLMRARFGSPAIVEANRLVEQADAVIVASPVYKASYTGLLKTYLDMLPQKGLAHKLIVPVMMGGTMAHLLAIDYALKPVLSALGATHQLQGVYAVDSQVVRNEDGTYAIDAELTARLDALADQVRDQLGQRAAIA